MLRLLEGSELLSLLPALGAYRDQLQARPAFQRALSLNGGVKAA